MLIIDRILSGVDIMIPPHYLEIRGDELARREIIEVSDLLGNVPVYTITNVAEYFYLVGGTYKSFADFPCVAPPAEAFWMEYSVDGEDTVGLLMQSLELTAEHLKWQLRVMVFTCRSGAGNQPIGPAMMYGVDVNSQGEAKKVYPLAPINEASDFESVKSYLDIAEKGVVVIAPALLALSFLNCKNVTVVDNNGLYASRQDRRAAQRRGDPDRVIYKTLQIEPMKKVLATEGGIAQNGLKKALHICRGHFAEYGEEFGKGKLFGKLEGRWFVQPHVRGSAESGTVHKRYNVKAPKEEAA